MSRPVVGAVVAVPFPHSDLGNVTVRPALVLAQDSHEDWVLCQITKNPYGDPHAVGITTTDFASGGLPLISYARPGKLFTMHDSLIGRRWGLVNADIKDEVADKTSKLLKEGGW